MWFSKSIEDVLKEINVDALSGLSDEEAKVRLKKYGANQLLTKKKKNIFQLFVAQLQEWLIYVLLAAVVITLIMGEYVDATIIILVIITNAVLGVIQEVKAGKAIEALQKMSFPKALVRRNGEVKEVNSHEVVPGDILILDAGRFISADIRLIESANLQIEESALTGESVSADKDAKQVYSDLKTPLGDRINMAFMSTLVTSGRGAGVVVETGMNTEVGKIANIINSEKKEKTPLEIRLDKLGKSLGLFAIGICVLIFVIAIIQGRDLAEMFILSVSLAVAAIPEGLAAIVAVVLSIGVTGMSKRKAVIKKLPAVETLGSVNIICSDKTGTLTQNKMTVKTYFNLEGEIVVERNSKNSATDDAKLLAKAMILNSDATYENSKGTGDPTEIALLLLGDDLGIDRKKLNTQASRASELSFDSDRKLMSTLYQENKEFTVYTKGAIGNLIKISTRVLEKGQVIPITKEHKKRYLDAAEIMSDNALRTLGVGYKPVDSVIEGAEMEKDLILVGLVGMIDPPRPEVKESIQKAKLAGITTIMITGDHKNTAFAIARELGMADSIDQSITGEALDDLSEKELAEKITQYRVFARVSPEHKVKIVHALKSHGNIVSMTGDGVNDAPSLNAADIGVAMGITGTDVAKGASDMILMDDNFATIVSAIEQGRNIYSNIKKAVVFLLTCNLGEVIAMFVTLMMGLAAPLIATQLLWINLITDSFPAIALGMDPGTPDVMKEKPRDAKESFFAGGAGFHIILGGMLIGALTILAFWYGYYEHGFSPFDKSAPVNTVEYARTMAFMVLVLCQMFFSLAVRNSSKSIFQIGIFTNKYLVGAIVLGVLLQLMVIMVPFMQRAFHLQMLDLRGWLIAISLGLVPLFVNEIIKIFIRVRANRIRHTNEKI
ncbi:cation-translocating P-type ATPase [Williamwhitmania taraxaci]|uniref:Ca2+-transporting ATPase n=1 Tax=Williamwhitmania taraxaci TaxID=1640674 RepID=A0A1G6QNQ6_9BACT|nr:cation-translocating P-type ATPase [Williamwhitmania taraxaci]SDC94030.1 Ca2+-transporting ATPase [Williamwhitmania taraxaci]